MSRNSKNRELPEKIAVATSIPARNLLSGVPEGWLVFGVSALLAALTGLVFFQTIRFDFIPYDDNVYVYENPEVSRGLTLKTIDWAFTHSDLYLWTPLTTLSHMLDCQLYGVTHPGGHHLTNVLLHMAAVVVLFLVLWRGTGALWRCAFVAAVFAIHPLRAESVAWVSERKDVLSGLFFMLTLGAYLIYVRKRSIARYAAVALLFAAGLMAKQMLVTLPCVLLLLDYWPLNRFAQSQKLSGTGGMPAFLDLVIEKLPLFALSAASCIQSFRGRTLEPGVVVTGLNQVSWLRIENALVSYVIYIGNLFYPVKLSVFYPYPAEVPAWQALGALALLASASATVWIWRKEHPELFTGWFWYLGTMVPVIGFISVGKEARADRYTYLPEIGLCVIVAWGAASLAAKWPYRREILCIVAALALALLVRLAVPQVQYWRNGVTLWQHAVACAPGDGTVHNYLGYSLLEENQDLAGAAAEYRKAIELSPDSAEPENNLGKILFLQSDVDGAIAHYNKALQLNAGHVEARSNLAIALTKKGLTGEAVAQLEMLVRYKPDRPDVRNNLGYALLENGDVDGAIAQFRKALEIKPDFGQAHMSLGNAFLQKSEPREAVAEYEKALKSDPQNALAALALARVLATSPDPSVRNGGKAVTLVSQVDDIDHNDPRVLDLLAAAFAEAGRFPDAVETARRAFELATAQGDTKLANDLQARLALYRANTPLRLPFTTSSNH